MGLESSAGDRQSFCARGALGRPQGPRGGQGVEAGGDDRGWRKRLRGGTLGRAAAQLSYVVSPSALAAERRAEWVIRVRRALGP